MNLLELFSTDRRLLETRGSLIIRQLCLNLNTERIYRTFAEIIEKEDVRMFYTYLSLSRKCYFIGSRIRQCHRPEVEYHPYHFPRTCRVSKETKES